MQIPTQNELDDFTRGYCAASHGCAIPAGVSQAWRDGYNLYFLHRFWRRRSLDS